MKTIKNTNLTTDEMNLILDSITFFCQARKNMAMLRGAEKFVEALKAEDQGKKLCDKLSVMWLKEGGS